MRHAFPALAVLLFLSACSSDDNGGDNPPPPPPPPVASLSLLAGNVGGAGSADGTGTAARFNNPQGITIDAAGNLYVADMSNQTIRKITPAGVVTTIAGRVNDIGTTDGPVATARFESPMKVAIDAAGNIYIADWSAYTIRKLTPGGIVSTIAGRYRECGAADGVGTAATFCYPEGIAAAADGTVFVSGSSIVRRISPAGVVSTLAGTYQQFGWADGVGPAARFNQNVGLALDASGAVLVADSANNAIRRIAPDGTTTTIAGVVGSSAHVDGPIATAKFTFPLGVGVDALGNIYVADSADSTIRRITPGGIVSTHAGTAGVRGDTDGTGAAALFDGPNSVVADAAGNIFVTDAFRNTIRRITPGGVVTTFAGSSAGSGSTDGSGTAAKFNVPAGVAIDSAGNAYVADGGGFQSGVIRRVTPAGAVTTIAGNAAEQPGVVDGVGSAARFNRPTGIAIDGSGNLYVTDVRCPPPFSRPPQEPCSGVIRRVRPDGTVTTIAGRDHFGGALDGIGTAATFSVPAGLVFDASGNLYIADTGTNTIRKMDATGMVTTLAGGVGQPAGDADGAGTAARFWSPTQIAIDAAGNLVVTDGLTYGRVRRVTPTGVVTTIAQGSEEQDHRSIAADSLGNLYLGDPRNYVIRKMTSSGAFTVVVGTVDQATFEPGALPGRIPAPRSLTLRGTDLYVTLGNGVAVVRNTP